MGCLDETNRKDLTENDNIKAMTWVMSMIQSSAKCKSVHVRLNSSLNC